jgi:hypothetical protein
VDVGDFDDATVHVHIGLEKNTSIRKVFLV